MDIYACKTLKLIAAPILLIKLNMSQRLQNMRIYFCTKKIIVFEKSLFCSWIFSLSAKL